jgi:exo-beta-1,3-glucanase (GH17 family)/cellulose synthase/poly-beta-1,6-N-acetylglucosamine synthase-like glycosyltransferase
VLERLRQFVRRRVSGGTLRIAIALFLVVGASALFWASRDFTVVAPDWDGLVRGVTYYPSHTFTSDQLKHIPPDRIDADMAQLSRITGHVRTYTVNYGLDKVPEIARRYGLTVSLGIWIGADLDKNEREIDKALSTILANRRVIDRVIVGNEAIMRGDVTADQLNGYIRRVREALPARIKVTTAETWSSWLLHPEVGEYCDVIFVHLLPYWEGANIRASMGFLLGAYNHVQEEFPDKPIVIGEVGWPSEGRTMGNAEASLANEAYFIRTFVALAMDKGYDYYIIEAYDQPWKAAIEGKGGAVGAYWGLFNADGHPKFPFFGLLRSFPQWRSYTFLAAVFSLLLGLLILSRMPRLKQPGYIVMGFLVALVTTGILLLIDATTLNYVDPTDIIMILAMSPLVFLASTVILTEGIELASSLWRVERRAVRAEIPQNAPLVSVHVPCYNEPPAMVMATLDALARLDYENFEVIVLDNNTPDAETWKPLEAHCAALGPKFRFFHFDNVKGFKAGALNIAIEVTNPATKYIAVIDSDYKVDPNWLRLTLPLFADEHISLVQGPQDYSDADTSLFKAMCYEEYRGFFQIGMVERNEHDAIIQHGTMTIVRKDMLEEVGGWATWCITEDTELGLRLFEAGYGAAYIPQSMGKGLIPDTLKAFQSQRYRWVYGAMQIMKHHAAPIFLGGTKLSWAQRYQFLSGWLPWFSDGLGMVVTFIALIWTFAMWFAPRWVDVPMPLLSAAALALFAAKMLKTLLLYPSKVGSGVRGAVMASVAGLSLTHTVGKAVWAGVFTSGTPFLRTPKCADEALLSQALRGVWQETTLFGFCIVAIISVLATGRYDDPAALLWIVMLAVQSLPYAATVVTAAISARGLAKAHPTAPAEQPPSLAKVA